MEIAINETNNAPSEMDEYGLNVSWIRHDDSSSTYELTAESVFDFWYSECQYCENPHDPFDPERISKFSFLYNVLL